LDQVRPNSGGRLAVPARFGRVSRFWNGPVCHRYLVVLLLLFTARQAFNVIIFPPFTGHDEVVHYAYTRNVATQHRVPEIPDLAEFRTAWVSKDTSSFDFLPADLYRYCRFVLDWNYCNNPLWANNPPLAVTLVGEIYPHGWQYAANHPPLYYVLMTPIYLATDHFSPVVQQYSLRAAAVPLGLLIVLLTFLIARLLFPRDDFIPIVATTFVAFETQVAYEAAMVNNDILLVFLFTLLVYLLVRGIRLGFDLSAVAVIGLVFGLGLLAKATMLSAAPLIALVVIFAVGIQHVRRWMAYGSTIVAIALAVSWPWYLFLHRTYGNFSALPQVKALQFSHTYRGEPKPSMLDLFWNGNFAKERWAETWGEFGWRLIHLRQWLLDAIGFPLLIMTVAAVLGLIWATWSWWKQDRHPARAELSGSQVGGLWLLIAVCVIAYGAMLQFGTEFELTQARYYFNGVAAVGILIAFGLRLLVPLRARPLFATLFLLFMISINVMIYSQAVLPYWYLPS